MGKRHESVKTLHTRTRVERTKEAGQWALICRGATGNLRRRSSLDDLAVALREHGCSSLRFDYQHSLYPRRGERLRTLKTMLADVARALAFVLGTNGRAPDFVVGRGFGARLALQALKRYPDVPLVMWAPIVWLQTSLEIRSRLHEIRRHGVTSFDNTRIGGRFVARLEDPTDAEIKSWIVPKRRHIIVHGKDDAVVPARFVDEAVKLIKSAGGGVQVIAVPGGHPHPGGNVAPQIAEIVKAVRRLG